ncbi:DUF4142 domain-containing protein [Erythrobacter sp. NFXS35]|uniref:DUF4142 domain-containing protein n=1 Tax=Erythrobacter sp. NFXS35 TaxID=2818436 RepID=UPI0032E009B7
MRIALIIASGLLATACDNREADDTAVLPADNMGQMAGQMGDNAMAADMPTTAEDYVQRTAISDMYEIQAGQLAVENGSSDEVRAFGRMMIDDHTASTRDLMAAAGQSGGPASMPTQLDSEHRAMIDRLENLDGENFDNEYMTQQMAAHRKALAMHEAYAERGDNAELRQFAQNVVPVIRGHYGRLERNTSAYGGTANNAMAGAGADNRMAPTR